QRPRQTWRPRSPSSWTRASRPTRLRLMSRARATPRARLPRLPTSLARPIAVAITGGIGAGKSEALDSFRRHGAATVSSDEIVHELLKHEDVKRAIVERMGNGVIGPDGELDRGAIATGVFNDVGALAWLEASLHTLVSAE